MNCFSIHKLSSFPKQNILIFIWFKTVFFKGYIYVNTASKAMNEIRWKAQAIWKTLFHYFLKKDMNNDCTLTKYPMYVPLDLVFKWKNILLMSKTECLLVHVGLVFMCSMSLLYFQSIHKCSLYYTSLRIWFPRFLKKLLCKLNQIQCKTFEYVLFNFCSNCQPCLFLQSKEIIMCKVWCRVMGWKIR